MNHKGIEYMVGTTATPGVWKWQFWIGDKVKTGKTATRINLLAIRRVQQRIDRELRKAEREQAAGLAGPASDGVMPITPTARIDGDSAAPD